MRSRVARQDPKHRCPKEGRNAKHAYSPKASAVAWNGHALRMTNDFQRKFSMEHYRRESALKVARRNATKTLSKAPRRISICDNK